MLLKLSDIWVRYGHISAVCGVSLEVAPGEVVSVIGPNGAGKTSLLAGIMGLAPQTGSIVLDGVALERRNSSARSAAGIGYVPTGRGVFGTLSVKENIAVACRGDFKRTWDRLTGWFPILAGKADALASQLSGGQRQMVSIARAMASAPKVLLLDEVSMGLSPIAIGQVREVVGILAREGVSIVLAEQNASLAMAVSDRCMVLVRGETRLAGTPGELRNRPEVEALYLGRSI
ncbi:ABC transporter ATP-binding protein [Rhodoligotrophos ferricapiens]|uniref:ABC transporter ATP-binding protein n=1 Tax=Rhodoligotrophos ferricapiens TaxID=3069264 RepID=UPI00315D29EC